MNSHTPELDQAFIETQGQRLRTLRQELLQGTRTEQAEESGLRSQSLGEAQELEDDAQKLTMLELEGNLTQRNQQRLAIVERALQKIADGTYGLSDASGQPIPRARLEAVPDAIFTLTELRARESADHRASDGQKSESKLL